MKIILDAMGGDNAPEAVVLGALDAAKDFNTEIILVGRGEDISPCFPMAELFDACGWEGSGFMQLQRQIRDITPLLHVQNLYWDGGLTDKLSTIDKETVDCYLWAEYFRETQGK